MAHKKTSHGSSKYASEGRYEKNKVRKLESYLRKNPNDLQSLKVLEEYKAKVK